MAGLGLAFSLLVFFVVYLQGIIQPVETLTAHAYGLGDMRLCSLYLNRTLLVVTFAYIPVVVFAYFLESILIMLGQEIVVVEYAQEYFMMVLPAIYLFMIFNVY